MVEYTVMMSVFSTAVPPMSGGTKYVCDYANPMSGFKSLVAWEAQDSINGLIPRVKLSLETQHGKATGRYFKIVVMPPGSYDSGKLPNAEV